MDVIEQNSSPNGVNTYNKADAGCFLTGGGSSGGACSHLGYYCGNDGLDLGSNTLYYCSGSGTSPSTSKACGVCPCAPCSLLGYLLWREGAVLARLRRHRAARALPLYSRAAIDVPFASVPHRRRCPRLCSARVPQGSRA